MTTYQAPQITDQRSVTGRLGECCSGPAPSDADIKHNIEPVQSTYQAPEISAQRDLDGRLGFDSIRDT